MEYCGILGHPLKKPRSIKIWKSFFRKNKIKCDMRGFDVKPKNLEKFFLHIKKDKYFLASAITMPYKIVSKNFIKNLDNYAKYSGAANLIIKKNKKLNGFNTDIHGALKSIGNNIKLHKNITVIGYGGTGSAILKYLLKKYKKNYLLVSKKNKHPNIVEKKCKIVKKLPKNELKKKQLIINCTPLGSDLKLSFLNKTPLNKNQLKDLNRESFIFDIVYKPRKTQLAKLCNSFKINYKNGLEMNTFQAEIAINLLIKNLSFFKNCIN